MAQKTAFNNSENVPTQNTKLQPRP